MKHTYRVLCILLLILISSCAVTENSAKRKIKRSFNTIKEMTTLYPNLADSITTKVTDTLEVEEVSKEHDLNLELDTAKFNNLLFDYNRTLHKIDSVAKVLDSLQAKAWITPKGNSSTKEESLNNYKALLNKANEMRKQLQKGAYRDTVIVCEDSLFKFVFVWKNGMPSVTYTKKKQKLAYIKSETNIGLNVAPKQPTWLRILNQTSYILAGILVILAILYAIFRR